MTEVELLFADDEAAVLPEVCLALVAPPVLTEVLPEEEVLLTALEEVDELEVLRTALEEPE